MDGSRPRPPQLALSAATIEGTDLTDFLQGTPGADQVLAKGGDDIVFGLGDDDRIDGGPGRDVLHGDGVCPPGTERPDVCTDDDDRTGGDDVLRGGDGDDVLLGGRGNDLLEGGRGRGFAVRRRRQRHGGRR